MPESVTDRPTKSHEYVFLLTKRPRYFFDQEAVREKADEVTRRAASFRDGGVYTGGRSFANSAENGKDTHGDGAPANGRNVRSVWDIATQPYPDAHFATFPEELARRCILAGTSERGVCPECGAPWTRETDVSYEKSPVHGAGSVVGRHYETGANNFDGAGMPRLDKRVTTTGWRPTCSCDGSPPEDHIPGSAPGAVGTPITQAMYDAAWGQTKRLHPVPATVLDPFLGSGTTAHVARKHGRRCVGIELNPSYAELAARRLQQLSLLAEPYEAHTPPAKARGLTGGAYHPPGQPPHSNAR